MVTLGAGKRLLVALALGCGPGCANRPPVLNCAPDPVAVLEGETLVVRSHARDPDDDPLQFNWSATSGIEANAVTFSDRNLRPENGSVVYDSSGVFQTRNLSAGRYTIKAEVSDLRHSVSCSVFVTVSKNRQPPTVACSPARFTITEGESRRLEVRAADPNRDDLRYQWAVNGQPLPNDRPVFEFGSVGRSAGNHSVTATVIDTDEMSASCEFAASISRRPNRNPTVHLLLDRSDVEGEELIRAAVRASDPDGDPLEYGWKINDRPAGEGNRQLVIRTAGLSGGRHSVTVTVKDDRGGRASAAQSFALREKLVLAMSGTRPDNLAKARLDEIALKMQHNPQLHARVTGHTDDRGSKGLNRRIGRRRAEGVRDYLIGQHQLSAERIQSGSAGEDRPLTDNKTPAGRRRNRRVEIELSAG